MSQVWSRGGIGPSWRRNVARAPRGVYGDVEIFSYSYRRPHYPGLPKNSVLSVSVSGISCVSLAGSVLEIVSPACMCIGVHSARDRYGIQNSPRRTECIYFSTVTVFGIAASDSDNGAVVVAVP